MEEFKGLISSFSPRPGNHGSWVWTKEGSGVYSVKSAYWLLQGEVKDVEGFIFNRLWSSKAHSNSIALAWKVFLNKVQTKSDLARRNALQVKARVDSGLCSRSSPIFQFFNSLVGLVEGMLVA